MDPPTKAAEYELQAACDYDPETNRLKGCPEFGDWYSEALAVCVEE